MSGARRRWGRDTRQAALAVFALGFLAYAAPLLVGWQSFDLDATAYDLPLLCAARRALAGSSPWVSSLFGGGSALAAEVGSVPFYPPRWIVWLLDPGTGRTLDVALHLGLAAAGVAVLARTFRVRALFACGAGLAFVALGPVADLLKHSALYAAGAAWGPWMWSFARLSRRPSMRIAPTGLAVCTALGLLSGDLQAVAVAAVVVAVESAAVLARTRAPAPFARVALAGLVGALAGMVQPALVLGEMPLSRRATGLATQEVLAGALDAVTLPGLVLPNALGVVVDGLPWTARAGGVTWLEASYVSATLLALVVAGARIRRVRAALVVTVAFVALALGPATPLGPFLVEHVPGANQLRYAAKLLPFALAAAVVVAAAAVDGARRERGRKRALLLVAVLGPALVVVAALVVTHGALTNPTVLGPLARALGVAAVAGALLAAKRVPWAAAVVVVDVAWAAASFAPYGPPLLDTPSVVGAVPRDQVVCVPPSVGSVRLPTGSPDARWSAAASRRAYDTPGLGACDDVVTAPAYQTLQPGIATEMEVALDDVPAAPVALGCTLALSTRPRPWLTPVPHEDLDAVARAGAGRPTMYAVADALPLASIARAPNVCADEDCTLKALVLAPRAADVHNLVDDPLHRLSSPSLPDGAAARVTGVAGASDDALDVTLDGTGGAVVVIRRPLLVGTVATQSGRALPVVRALGHLIAVVVNDVAAGPVHVGYRPPGFMLGIGLSLVGLALVVGLTVVSARGRRRGPRASAPGG